MKRSIALVFAILLGFQAFAHTSVAISGIASVDLSSQLSLDEAVSAFQTKDPFCGLGWEVVIDEVGLGGTYLVNFFQTSSSDWWLDWYGEGLYLSYHLFGASALIDPFVRAGIGCAGRVILAGDAGDAEPLAISVFPFVGAGADVRLGALNLGATVDYLPRTSGIPATLIQAYPLGRFQTSVLAGFKLGGGRRR